jgi:hypothetical protein
MNKAFDYNGVIVSPSKPVKALKTVKKTLHIDSADRDTAKYYTNGDVVYYLPRVYENVVSLRLKSATFPRLYDDGNEAALVHSYLNGQNVPSATYVGKDTAISSPPKYFLVGIEGLNKSDETTVGANRSSYTDSFFAKIPVNLAQNSSSSLFVNYNDHTEEDNIAKFFPAIGKLDRLRVVTRLHNQQDKSGFIYWTSDGSPAAAGNRGDVTDYSLTLEIEYLDNSFDDFSSFETRIGERGAGQFSSY